MRQFTATELAPESAYIFRLSAKTRQGWGEPLEATVITTEKRGKPSRPKLISWSGGDGLGPCTSSPQQLRNRTCYSAA